jgi:predicted nucleotidyltransferase
MTRQQVMDRLRTEAARLRMEFGVKSLLLFGSVARGEATEESDIDLLAEFDRPIGLFHLVRTQQFLESLLGQPVDLVTEGGLKPRVRQRVLREAVHVG